MFCKYCGKKIDSSDRFCDGCGANLQETVSVNPTEISKMLNDGKGILKSFFSKNPANAINKAKTADSWIGAVILTFAAILYSFISCLNATQNLNSVLESINDTIYVNAMKAIGSYSSELGGYLPNFEMPFLIELFIPFFFLAVVAGGLVFGGLFLSLKVREKPIPDLKSCLNMLGTTSLPIVTALAINLIIGFILPQASIFIFAVGIFVSAIFVYEILRSFYGDDYKPILEMLIIAVAVLLASAIFIAITVNIVGNELENTLMSELDRMVDDGTNLMNDFLGSIF